MKTLEIYVDGAARKNPGPAAYAFIIIGRGKVIFKYSDYIGITTNNVAEYQAIINSLQKATELTAKHIKLFSDSQLAIKQITGGWKINKPHLGVLNNKVQSLKKKFQSIEFQHISRENKFIQVCDTLCNETLDKEGF